MTLEARSEQNSCRDAFSEQCPQGFGVVMLSENLLPGFLEPHERAADLQILEHEGLNFVQRLILQAAVAGPR